jgi:hypothetical protein
VNNIKIEVRETDLSVMDWITLAEDGWQMEGSLNKMIKLGFITFWAVPE